MESDTQESIGTPMEPQDIGININGETDSDYSAIIIMLMVLGGGVFYTLWKSGSSKGINKRLGKYNEKKAQYAEMIKVNDEKQLEISLQIDENTKLGKEKEVEIKKIVEDSTKRISELLQGEDKSKIVKRYRKSDF
jgi:hypothetical protein